VFFLEGGGYGHGNFYGHSKIGDKLSVFSTSHPHSMVGVEVKLCQMAILI